MEVVAVLFWQLLLFFSNSSGFCYCFAADVVCFWADRVLTTTGFVLVLL